MNVRFGSKADMCSALADVRSLDPAAVFRYFGIDDFVSIHFERRVSTLLISAHQPAVAGTWPRGWRPNAVRRALGQRVALILNRVYGQGEYVSIERHVRFGSKADMCSAQADVR